MEEILASIRKIISEDSPEAAPQAAPPPAAAPAPEPVHDDVLELTQEVEPVPPPPPAPQPAPPVARPPAEDIVFQSVTPAPAMSEHSDIFSDHTRKAMEDTFNSIPDEDEPVPAPRSPAPIAPIDGASVEAVFERAIRESFEPVMQKYLSDNSGMIVERMKPLIREWMDEHFPPLLEGAVRAEVERVVKARGTKR
jgi:uncharacterized protein